MTTTSNPNVSVVVCHHTGNFVPAFIRSVKKSIGVDPEIIVVTSAHNTTFVGAKTIYFNGGPSEKRNIGAKAAKTDYLFFLDDDTEVEPTFLFHMKKAMKAGAGMVYGKTLNMERRNMLDNAGSFLTWTGFLWAREESGQIEDNDQFNEPEYIFAGKGAAMALRRDTFNKVGGFDPVYEILAEETDISWKVWFIGEKVLWVPEAVLFHAFNSKFKEWKYFYTNKRVFFNGCRNYILMLASFLEVKNLIRILPLHMFVWFCAGIGMFFTKKPAAGVNILKGLAWHLFNIPTTLKKRKREQKLRTKSDKELFKYILRQPKFSFYWNRFWHYLKYARHG